LDGHRPFLVLLNGCYRACLRVEPYTGEILSPPRGWACLDGGDRLGSLRFRRTAERPGRRVGSDHGVRSQRQVCDARSGRFRTSGHPAVVSRGVVAAGPCAVKGRTRSRGEGYLCSRELQQPAPPNRAQQRVGSRLRRDHIRERRTTWLRRSPPWSFALVRAQVHRRDGEVFGAGNSRVASTRTIGWRRAVVPRPTWGRPERTCRPGAEKGRSQQAAGFSSPRGADCPCLGVHSAIQPLAGARV
jgi:hypothetical protein